MLSRAKDFANEEEPAWRQYAECSGGPTGTRYTDQTNAKQTMTAPPKTHRLAEGRVITVMEPVSTDLP